MSQPTYTFDLPGGTDGGGRPDSGRPEPVPSSATTRARPGAAGPRRRAVPQRADRLLAALRRQQLDGRRRAGRPAAADRHPAGRHRRDRHRPAVASAARRYPTPSTRRSRLEVEESSDGPDALLLRLPVNRTSRGPPVRRRRHLRAVHPDQHGRHPGAGQSAQCVFDGYVLSWQLHLDRTSIVLDPRRLGPGRLVAHEHRRQRRGVAGPDRRGGRQRHLRQLRVHRRRRQHRRRLTQSTTPTRTRCSSGRPTCSSCAAWPGAAGRICRVACTDTPGDRTGYFVQPGRRRPAGRHDLAGRPDQLDGRHPRLRLGRDAPDGSGRRPGRPHSVRPTTGCRADHQTRSGLTALGAPRLSHLCGPVLDASADRARRRAGADQRTAAVLTESGFFTRCTGEADADRLGTILRVGDIVTIEGAGSHPLGQLAGLERAAPLLARLVQDAASRSSATRWARRRGGRALVLGATSPPGPIRRSL